MGSDLNAEKCVLCLGGEASMCKAVKAVAEEYYAKAGKDMSAMPLRFFTAPMGQVGDQIYALTKQAGNKLILLDIPSGGAFYVCEAEAPDAAAVRSFILNVHAAKVERKQLQNRNAPHFDCRLCLRRCIAALLWCCCRRC